MPAQFYRISRWPLRRGFTLVEIIFAASLLALVMIMMFNLMPGALLGVRVSEHRVKAYSQGQSILEAARNSFAQLVSPTPGTRFSPCAVSTDTDGTYYVSDETVDKNPSDTPSAVNTDGSGHYAPRLVSVSVTTWWNERDDAPTPAQYHQWSPHVVTQQMEIGNFGQ